MTLSGLLNAIDGVAAQEGRLLVMTTNHRERLDEALLRPGRVDVQLRLERASRAAAGQLFDQFFGHASMSSGPSASSGDDAASDAAAARAEREGVRAARATFLAAVEDGAHSFAALQGVLMDARDDAAAAASGVRLLVAAAAAAANSHG